MRYLPKYIKRAIRSGPVPRVRDWRAIAENAKDGDDLNAKLTLAELTMFFIESVLVVPEGSRTGEPFKLDLFQEVFIYAVFDNKKKTRRAYLSMARKNGKTALIAALLIAFLIGPPSGGTANAQLISGAMSREQAGLVYSLAEKMINLSEVLANCLRPVPSRKSIIDLYKSNEYRAISAEASTAHGLSPKVAILDEIGQIVGSASPFVEAVTTAQGAHSEPLLIAISTSAASDADLFSIWCDDAERSADPHTVCHVYSAEDECELLDRKQWQFANPALGKFRNEDDLKQQLEQAKRLTGMEASKRNLLLNQRVSLERLWLAPAIWKSNSAKPDWEVALKNGGHLGLDLSKKQDLTAAVLVCKDDDGFLHVFPFAFTPAQGIDDRSRRDRVPYNEWAKQGILHAPPSPTIDYDWVSGFCKKVFEDAGVTLHSIQFDDWRIEDFKVAAARQGFAQTTEWVNVRQGYKSISPRIEAMETALLQDKFRHGGHPVLNLGASGAIVVQDPTGSRKLDKNKASRKIDALVAMLMAAYPCIVQEEPDNDISWWIGEKPGLYTYMKAV